MDEPTFAEVSTVVAGLRRLDTLGVFGTEEQARACLAVQIRLWDWIAALPDEALTLPPAVEADSGEVAGQAVLPFGGEH